MITFPVFCIRKISIRINIVLIRVIELYIGSMTLKFNKLILLFYILSFILLIVCTNCNKLNYVKSKDKFEEVHSSKLSKLDEFINHKISNNLIPGSVILVSSNNKIIHHKSYGYKNLKKKIKFKNDDIFRIASMTKIITSIAILEMVVNEKINLNEPILNFIPEFKSLDVLDTFNPKDTTYTTIPAQKKVTLKHLLKHTAGFGYGKADNHSVFSAIYQKNKIVELFSSADILLGDNLKKILSLPLHHEPGEGFSYGMSTEIIAYLIEILSGKNLNDYLNEKIFTPIGMNDTYFYLPKSKSDRLVPVQTNLDGFWKIYESDFFDINYPINGSTFFSGGAGLSTTALDFYKFLNMLMNNGIYESERIVDEKVFELIYNYDELNSKKGFKYGLISGIEELKYFEIDNPNVKVDKNNCNLLLYWTGYFDTQFVYDPCNKISIVVLKQLQDNEYDELFLKELIEVVYNNL